MARGAATLRINADAADVKKAFGAIAQAARKMNSDMLSSTKKSNAGAVRSLKELQREYATLAMNVRNVTEASGRMRISTERKVTRGVATEVTKRMSAEQRAAAQHEALMGRMVNVHARVEQMKTAKTLGEVYKRIQQEDRAYDRAAGRRRSGGRYNSNFGQGSFNVAGAARSFATDAHSQVQGARGARASTERTLDSAFIQAVPSGATAGEIDARRRQVYAFARQEGIREEEIAPAFAEAQTRFAFFSNGTDAADRERRTTGFTQALELGRTTGNNLTDTGNFYASLMSAGGGNMSPEAALALTRQGAAASYMGSVSLGSLSSQALGSMLQSVSLARSNARSSGGDESAAGTQAVRRFFADMQIQAAVGARVGVSGVREVGLERALQGNTVNMMYHRMRERFANNPAQLGRVDEMFSVTGTGRNRRASIREEYRDPAQFGAQLYQMFDGNGASMANFMGARGQWGKDAGGATRVLTAPIVTALSNMFSVGPDAMQQRNRIMGADLTDSNLATMRTVRRGEQDTTLATNEQTQRDALRNNTNAMVRLSDQLNNWSSRNPFTASAFSSLGTALGAGFIMRMGTFRWAGAAGSALAGGGELAGAGSVASALAGLGTAAVAAAALLGAGMAAYGLYRMNQDVNDRTGTTLGERASATLSGGAAEQALGDRIEANRERQRQFNVAQAQAARVRREGGQEAYDAHTQAAFGGGAPSSVERDTTGDVHLSQASVRELVTGLIGARAEPQVFQLDLHEIDWSNARLATANNTGQGGQ